MSQCSRKVSINGKGRRSMTRRNETSTEVADQNKRQLLHLTKHLSSAHDNQQMMMFVLFVFLQEEEVVNLLKDVVSRSN